MGAWASAAAYEEFMSIRLHIPDVVVERDTYFREGGRLNGRKEKRGERTKLEEKRS